MFQCSKVTVAVACHLTESTRSTRVRTQRAERPQLGANFGLASCKLSHGKKPSSSEVPGGARRCPAWEAKVSLSRWHRCSLTPLQATVSGVWVCLDVSGCVRMCLDVSGFVWKLGGRRRIPGKHIETSQEMLP